MSSGGGGLHLLPFNGDRESWPVWSTKFLERARRQKYKRLLTGKDVCVGDSKYEAILGKGKMYLDDDDETKVTNYCTSQKIYFNKFT